MKRSLTFCHSERSEESALFPPVAGSRSTIVTPRRDFERSEKSLFAFSNGRNPARNRNFERKTTLCGLFQGALDEGQAALGLFAKEFFAVAAIFLRAVEFVGNRQRREHRNFLRVDRRSARRNRVHFFVDVLRQVVDVCFVQFTANRVRLPEYLDFHGTAHVSGL